MPSSKSHTRTERTVCLLVASAQCMCFWLGMNVSSEHTVCFSGSWHLFQIAIVPKEHCTCVSHMLNLSVLCRGYGVQGWALLCFVCCTFRLCSVIGPVSFSCVPVGWQLFPGSRPQLYSQHVTVYIESKVPLEIFPQKPHLLCSPVKLIFIKLNVERRAANWSRGFVITHSVYTCVSGVCACD